MSLSSSQPRSAEGEVQGATRRPLRLAIALDLDDVAEARRLAEAVAPYFGVAKVGLELFSVGGPAVVTDLLADGFAVFVDLKLHDIPTTVQRAAHALGRLGASFATVHAAGGHDVVAAAVAGLREGADEAGFPAPVTLGVTVLTSEPDAPPALLEARVRVVLGAGADGLVCAAEDLAVVRRLAPTAVTVVPGIRPAGADHDDQARVATPEAAALAGADVLVIGRAVSRAPDPATAARAIAQRVGLA